MNTLLIDHQIREKSGLKIKILRKDRVKYPSSKDYGSLILLQKGNYIPTLTKGKDDTSYRERQ